ncbi:MAG: winged helix-turn-helix transcriptional regulator [Deltaproteobacteria bacterium]|nr:winged helix-turn-helix transcriptional regulator [Deltaproteobacteria bacterium]MBW1930795.1 winged helix-turn-helix transcriptional regulator [Deltaproteobacteria bacterium]MBW2024724.1 winged helix-turn-helix transcriptional regulator [Deltaproteobacteria bacterium]MBW2125471.1 winged helix-turn-helix transcriptional regulator [Deltaproteobacteria bacterium]
MKREKDNEKCNLAVALPEDMTLETAQQELGRLSKGLAHPVRVKIITMLAGRPPENKCFCGDIVDALPLAQSTVSQHLKVLKDTGWLQGEIHGPRVCYCLVDGILDYYQWLLHKCTSIKNATARKRKRRR